MKIVAIICCALLVILFVGKALSNYNALHDEVVRLRQFRAVICGPSLSNPREGAPEACQDDGNPYIRVEP